MIKILILGYFPKQLIINILHFQRRTVFPLISTAPFGFYSEIKASLLINAALLNEALFRIVTIFY